MGNGYGDFINKQFKQVKEPKTYKTTGTQYNKAQEQERSAIRSQLANDIAYWSQKRGTPIDTSSNPVAVAENYYKTQEKRAEIEKAGQKRMSENGGKGKYTAEDRLAESKKYSEKDRVTSANAYEKEIGKTLTSDFKKGYNYSTNSGITGSDVRFEAFMDKLKNQKNTVAQQLAPEFNVKEEKKNNFLQNLGKKAGQGVDKSMDFLASLTVFNDSGYKRSQEEKKAKGIERSGLDRFATRAANTANLGIPAQLQKRATGEQAYYATQREVGHGGGADMAADLLGYLAPGTTIAKGVRGTKLGAKGVEGLLKKGVTKETAKQIAKQTAKEGAAVGGIMSGAEIAGREALNPDDYNWKQNLAQFGLETGAGAVLDPAMTLGIGKLISKIKKPPTGASPVEKSILETLAVLPSPQKGNAIPGPQARETGEPFQGFLKQLSSPYLSKELAATTTKQRPGLEALKKAFKGQDVPTTSNIAKQADSTNIVPNKSEIADKLTPAAEADYTKGVAVETLKDISGFKGATSDVYRIFDDVFGKNSPVTKRVLGELDASKSRYVNMQETLLKELDDNIVKGLGIKKGSKLSRYVQDYGEKKMDLPTLREKAPDDWEKVVEADKWFRAKYDSLIDEVNASRKLAYPNSPDKQIPKRNDYYRHFTEFTSLTGLKNIFDTPSAIDPHLAGTSEFTKPGSKYAGFMQRRGLGPYKSDAVGGFLNYVPSASYAKEIDPNIKNIRAFRSELADITQDSRNLNDFIGYLDKYSNDLAGKTNPYLDRNVQDIIGRKPMAFLNWMNGRVKTNTILGNLASTLAQVANMPLGLAFAKQHSVKGISRTMKALLDNTEPIHQSAFMKERYSDSMYRKFDQRWIEQPQKMAEWLIETSDRVGSSFVWNSAYEKGLKQGVSNPIKYADDNTRRMVAGRGVGEVPLLQKSKVVQMVMPFTLEVGNQWYVMRDMVKSKDFVGLPLMLVANHVLNKAMEEIRGDAVTFDPIDAVKEGMNDGLSPARIGGRLGGEVLSNIPGGQYLAGLYPEYGGIGGVKTPTRADLFADRNPQRFGTGLVLNNGVTDPLFKLLPPFGGNQLKKTLGGLEVMQNGGSFKKGTGKLSGLPFMGKTDELKFPIENSPEDKLKMLLFGPNASDNAREYFDNKRSPLGVKQTEEYKKAVDRGKGQEFYESILKTRSDDSVKRKIKEIEKDKTLTDEERRKRLLKVLKLDESK
ncbi:hypothetical protein [Psychrobacillus sp. L3]|uniref:hypothetical protein n=1 Tax=Psychrobacillus sp. L3 TaxID=3236891 RepID=UPI0036F1C6E0